MFTSDTNNKRNTQSDRRYKTVFVYLVLSALCIVVDNVYALFGHGVRSASMSFMFLYSFLGGAVLFLLIGIFTPYTKRGRYRLGYNIYNSGIATLTVGSFFKGILDIAGTSSGLGILFTGSGLVCVITGLCLLTIFVIRGGKRIEKTVT